MSVYDLAPDHAVIGSDETVTIVEMAAPASTPQVPRAVEPPETTEIDRHFGVRLKQLRRLRELSQVDLGSLLGITFQQVQKYERGINRLTASRLVQICHLLNVPPSWFYEGLSHAAPIVFQEGSIELVVMWSALTASNRRLVIEMVKALPQKAA